MYVNSELMIRLVGVPKTHSTSSKVFNIRVLTKFWYAESFISSFKTYLIVLFCYNNAFMANLMYDRMVIKLSVWLHEISLQRLKQE
jgi:hypothetical protein